MISRIYKADANAPAQFNRYTRVILRYLHSCLRLCGGNKSWPTTRNTDKTHETKQNHVLDCRMTTTVVYELRKGCICDPMNDMCKPPGVHVDLVAFNFLDNMSTVVELGF